MPDPGWLHLWSARIYTSRDAPLRLRRPSRLVWTAIVPTVRGEREGARVTGQGAPDPREEVDRLRGEIERLANLAAEHLACSGCPTPWWLNNWLLAVASDSTVQPDTAAPDAAPKEAGG